MSQEKKSRKSLLDVPEFMRADAGKGTEKIVSHDCAWIGKDGELDEVALSKIEREVRPLNQAIAVAKAAGEARNSAVAVGRAAIKLHMPWEARKRGPKRHVDDYLLCRIAEAYHHRFFERPQEYPALDPIIDGLVERHLLTTAPKSQSKAALIARLRRKFNEQKDGLLSAVGAEDLPERGAALARARGELDGLEKAGVPIDRSCLDPALIKRPKRA